MTDPIEFTFRMERTSWKSHDLIYEEAGHRVVIYLELSGIRDFDWVGTNADLEKWTVPDGEPISLSKRYEILDRLSDWGEEHKVRIDLGSTVSMEETCADYEKKGWHVEHKPDGSTLVTPPQPEGLMKRLARLFGVR